MSSQRTKATIVIKNIGQLLTIRGFSAKPALRPTIESLGVMQGTEICVAAQDAKICFIGRISDASQKFDFSEADEVDAHGSLVLPGFVDPHTHSVFSGSRENELAQKLQGASYLEILARGGGILRTVTQTRAATDVDIISQTKARLDRMLRSGTTTFEVKSGYGLSVNEELRLLKLLSELKVRGYDIVPTLLSAHAVPPEFNHDSDKYVREVVIPTVDAAAKQKLASFFDVFLEEGVFSLEQCRSMLMYAREKGFALKIHADEFSDLSGAKLAAEMPVTSSDHMLQSSPTNLELLGPAGVISVLLPGTSLTSFSRTFANARKIIDSGGAVALGTDLSPNSWIESMHLVICLACYCMKITPAESIVGATINAAHAIGRSKDVGSIEFGKKCDLLITNLKSFEEIPYRFGSNIVQKVVKNGKVANDS